MEDLKGESADIGPYRVLDVLGEGGMGVVYAAEQRKPIFRRVALKVIKIGMDTKEVLARFEAERQALALLDHPNVARVLDAGATPEGRPYFAMELVRGLPIARYCDEGRLSVKERIEVVLQACAALQHAHERGIIHRDIKPTNLLVTEVDGKPVVKVIDFGLAKAINQRLTERTLFTEEGRIIGTPEYMSPEQAETSAQDVDARSDVFSLGVVLYELLAGALPFDFKAVRAKGYFELQRFIREQEPPTPLQRLSSLKNSLEQILALRRCRLQELSVSLRNGLDAVTMKAIAKQRRDRYGSCEELAADLRRFLAGEPVSARKAGALASLRRRIRSFQRRHPTVVPAVVLASLAAGAVWWAMRTEVLQRNGASALDPAGGESQLRGDKAVARVAADAQLTEDLGKLADDLRGKGDASSALGLYGIVLGQLRQAYPDGDPAIAVALQKVGSSLQAIGKHEDALREFENALAMRRRLADGADDQGVAAALSSVASCLQTLGRLEDALAGFQAALAMRRRLLGAQDHADVVISLDSVAGCLVAMGRGGDARLSARESASMRARLDPDGMEKARSLSSSANLLMAEGRSAEALPQLEAALAMNRRLFGDGDHRDVAASLSNVAACLDSLGRSSEALPQYQAALSMQKRLNGDDDPEVARGLSNVAACLHSLGSLSDALPQYEAALAMQRRLNGDRDHPEVARGLNSLASCLESLGRSSEALRQHEAALAMRKRLYGDGDHREVAQSLNSVAACLDALGRSSEALPEYEAAFAMQRRLYGDRDHPDVAQSLNGMALCLQSLGRSGEALPEYDAALAMQRRLYGDRDHQDVAQSLNGMALCLQSLGRSGEALPEYVTALAMQRRLYGDRDHPDVAQSLNGMALCLQSLGRTSEALREYEAALTMQRRLYGDSDHPDVALSLNSVAGCLDALGRSTEAVPHCEASCAMIERLRAMSALSVPHKLLYFDKLKRGGAFERLQSLQRQRNTEASWSVAERSRARDLLDLLEQQRADPLAEAEERAARRGDETGRARLQRLRSDLAAVSLEGDRLLHELARLDDAASEAERDARRAQLLAQSTANATHMRRLQDERARWLAGVLPVGHVRTSAEVQSALREGELLLEFTVTEDVALLYVLPREGSIEIVELPLAHATVERVLPDLLQRNSRQQLLARRHNPAGPPAATVPPSRRNEWLDRSHERDSAASRELFASLIPAAVWERVSKAKHVFVAAHRELHYLPFELLVTDIQDGKPIYWLDSGPLVAYVPSGSALHWLRQRAAEVADDAAEFDLLAVSAPLGIHATRAGGRRRELPQLPGARAEIAAIEKGFAAMNCKTRLLLDADATESAVFAAAQKTKFVHFAGYAVPEEDVGQSTTMLVLSQPQHVLSDDDGLLKLSDLMQNWLGRLASCRLVVLSACSTNLGPTLRDEAPQALPIGFLFAGAPSVISSLWAVDDQSTQELMIDFYSRLLAGETDRLAALTAAKKVMRSKNSDPYYWAPFLFLGSPE